MLIKKLILKNILVNIKFYEQERDLMSNIILIWKCWASRKLFSWFKLTISFALGYN